jgi:hypothetical protein
MHRFLPVMVLLFNLSTYAQLDQKKLDSLSRSIDSSAKASRNWQDSFTKIQDSIYQTAIGKSAGGNSINPSQFLAEQEKRESRERQRILLRFLAGVAVVLIGVVAWFLKTKRKA